MMIIAQVTKDDIFNGKSHPEYCPLALALQRLGYVDAEVTETEWRIDGRSHTLTKKAQDFVVKFDSHLNVGSGRFAFYYDE